jgi:hypothetical protein
MNFKEKKIYTSIYLFINICSNLGGRKKRNQDEEKVAIGKSRNRLATFGYLVGRDYKGFPCYFIIIKQ